MKQTLLLLCCFLLGAGGILGIRYQMTKPSRPLLDDPQYLIGPPKNASWGTISTDDGIIELRGPHDDAFHEVKNGTVVKQGDSVFVKKGMGIVAFYTNALSMEEGSEVFFENLFPDHLFMRQRSGTVLYETQETPISIRVQRSLVWLNEGSMKVTVTGDRGVIELTGGKARIGNIDVDNNTTTYLLEPGDQATVDRELQTVVVR